MSTIESSFECTEMRLLGRHGETLANGSGCLRLDGYGDFHFELVGETVRSDELIEFISAHRRNPYDGLWRFRLVVTHPNGQELHCGYVTDQAIRFVSNEPLSCSGRVEGLSFDTPSLGEVGTEILLIVPERHWLSQALAVSLPRPDEDGVSRYSAKVVGSLLEFEYQQKSRSLTISVTGSDVFPQTYTEGWLSEPLRMMLGQLAFPRVIVRSNANRAMVMIPQIRRWHGEADGFSLLDPATTFEDRNLLFEMYAELLQFVASARGVDGMPNFERHPLTRFYEELAQAMHGSRWIMTLTLASAVEGGLNLLFPPNSTDENANLIELEDLKDHIDKWVGHPTSSAASIASLKDRAKGAISYTAEMTAIKRLRLLVVEKKVTKDEVMAWEKVRHKVAHGNIFSPFSSDENDRLILNLMRLFRRIAGLITLGRNPPSMGLVGLIQ